MSKLQKFAVFNLILSSIGMMIHIFILLSGNILLKAIASTLVTFFVALPIMISYLSRRKYQKQGDQFYDERDRLLHKKAITIGFLSMALTLTFVVFVAFVIVGPRNSIPILSLLNILLLCLMSVFFAESIAILVQYNWTGKGEIS